MEVKKPLDVIGWLGSSGYRMVVDEPSKAEATKKLKEKLIPKEGKGG